MRGMGYIPQVEELTIGKGDTCLIRIKDDYGVVKYKYITIYHISSDEDFILGYVSIWKEYDIKFIRININDITSISKYDNPNQLLTPTGINKFSDISCVVQLFNVKKAMFGSDLLELDKQYVIKLKNNDCAYLYRVEEFIMSNYGIDVILYNTRMNIRSRVNINNIIAIR